MSASVQQMPNYNAMHRQDTTPLIGAATPGDQQEGFNLPVAASDVLGGFGGFSSW
jgi:hypothetical protein